MNAVNERKLGLDGENIPSKDSKKCFVRKKNQNLSEAGNCRDREISVIKENASFPILKYQDLVEIHQSVQRNSKINSSTDVMDLECRVLADSRYLLYHL